MLPQHSRTCQINLQTYLLINVGLLCLSLVGYHQSLLLLFRVHISYSRLLKLKIRFVFEQLSLSLFNQYFYHSFQANLIQRMSGINAFVFWSSHYVFDFCYHLVVSTFIFITLAYSDDAFLFDANLISNIFVLNSILLDF